MTWSEWQQQGQLEFQDIIFEKKQHNGLMGSVARVTFNRPHRMNAFTSHTIEEVWEAIDDVNRDAQVGVLVLTGAGDKAFCSGGDVEWESQGGTRKLLYAGAPSMDEFVRRCRKPVIAAVKGYAIGGGNHLAYCCDITIAADNAVFGQNGPRVGSPADGWTVAYLIRVVGAKKAREMWLTCRRYRAQEALEMGLVNAVVPLDKLDEEVDRMCEDILGSSPTCVEILKASFDAEFDYYRSTSGQFRRLIAPSFAETEECKEAQRAFFEKRPPNFWKFRVPKDT